MIPLQALLPIKGMSSLYYRDELPEIAGCLEYVINTDGMPIPAVLMPSLYSLATSSISSLIVKDDVIERIASVSNGINTISCTSGGGVDAIAGFASY